MSLTLKIAPAAKTVKTPKADRKPSKAAQVKATKAKVIGGVFFALAIAVLSVSLPHLAQGMKATLGVEPFAAAALAVLFDLSQIASEAFLLTLAKEKTEKRVAQGVIFGATAVSVAYNGMAFLSHANGWFGVATAVTLAGLMPIGVLALSYLGSRSLFGK